MSSEIRTDLIKDKSNTKTLATLSSSAVTLDSSVVVPASVGGTMIYLDKFTASNTNEKIFNLDLFTAFNNYMLLLDHVKPVTDQVVARFQTGTSASSFADANNDYENVSSYSYNNLSSVGDTYDNSSVAIIQATNVSSDSGLGLTGTCFLHRPLDSSLHTNATYNITYVTHLSYTIALSGAGTRLALSDDAYLRFKFSSGNIDSGTITLYGIKDA